MYNRVLLLSEKIFSESSKIQQSKVKLSGFFAKSAKPRLISSVGSAYQYST